MTLFLATLYVCMGLRGGEALACNAATASAPPQHVQVTIGMCGPYVWPSGVAFIDCGSPS